MSGEIPYRDFGPRILFKPGPSGAYVFAPMLTGPPARILEAVAFTAPPLRCNLLVITEGWRPVIPERPSLHPFLGAWDFRTIDRNDLHRPGTIVAPSFEDQVEVGRAWRKRAAEVLGSDYDLVFGDYLLEKGKEEMAEEAYLTGLQLVKNEKIKENSPFLKVSQYYAKKEHFEEALKILQEAVELLPRDKMIRLTTGSLYENQGIVYRAIEEYRKALVLDPGNRWVENRLEKLVQKNSPL